MGWCDEKGLEDSIIFLPSKDYTRMVVMLPFGFKDESSKLPSELFLEKSSSGWWHTLIRDPGSNFKIRLDRFFLMDFSSGRKRAAAISKCNLIPAMSRIVPRHPYSCRNRRIIGGITRPPTPTPHTAIPEVKRDRLIAMLLVGCWVWKNEIWLMYFRLSNTNRLLRHAFSQNINQPPREKGDKPIQFQSQKPLRMLSVRDNWH